MKILKLILVDILAIVTLTSLAWVLAGISAVQHWVSGK